MAPNGSCTATMSPTASGSDQVTSQTLASSISSLSSSVARNRTSISSLITKTYRQSSQLFLTRRLPEALSTILPLITPPSEGGEGTGANDPAPVAQASRSMRVKVWSLYLTILNAVLELDPNYGKEAFGTQEWRSLCSKVRDGQVWEEVIRNGYHGIEGDVDSDVVVNLATLLLAHARTQTLNQKRLETFLAASQQPIPDVTEGLPASQSPTRSSKSRRSPSKSKATSGAETPRELNARVKVLELYTLHVLLRNNEWDYAREFISVSSVLDEERRDAFLQALHSLQEEQLKQESSQREEKRRQDERLRRDLDEARRLKADNDAREKQRLGEERARRNGHEPVHGIERKSTHSGSSKGRHARAGSATPKDPSAKGQAKSAVTPTFTARAAIIFTNMQRGVELMATSLNSKPALLMRLVAFIVAMLVVLGKKDLRQRLNQTLVLGWNKVKATGGMGLKITSI